MFEGFGLEFMVGSAIFGLLNLITVTVFVFIALGIWALIIAYYKEDEVSFSDFKFVTFVGVIFSIVIMAMIPTVLVNPKVGINIPKNAAQMEFETTPKVFEFVTPPPRTETLDGFTPLKQD